MSLGRIHVQFKSCRAVLRMLQTAYRPRQRSVTRVKAPESSNSALNAYRRGSVANSKPLGPKDHYCAAAQLGEAKM